MKELIEDYKKEIRILEINIHPAKRIGLPVGIWKAQAQCYRTFITELERIEKEINK